MASPLEQIEGCIAELDLWAERLRAFHEFISGEPMLSMLLSSDFDRTRPYSLFRNFAVNLDEVRKSTPQLDLVLNLFASHANEWKTINELSELTAIPRHNLDYLLSRSKHARLFEHEQNGQRRNVRWRAKSHVIEQLPSASLQMTGAGPPEGESSAV